MMVLWVVEKIDDNLHEELCKKFELECYSYGTTVDQKHSIYYLYTFEHPDPIRNIKKGFAEILDIIARREESVVILNPSSPFSAFGLVFAIAKPMNIMYTILQELVFDFIVFSPTYMIGVFDPFEIIFNPQLLKDLYKLLECPAHNIAVVIRSEELQSIG